jgi:hypothetical protein
LVVQKTTLPAGDTTQFAINATGTGTITGGGAGIVTDATDKVYEVATGTYSVTETVPNGWSQTSNTCTNVVVGAGESKTCLITNTKQPTLTLVKTVTNNNGGTATAANFQGKIDGNNVAWGTPTVVSLGAHTASEVTLPGYTASDWGGACAANGAVTLAAGENKTCTITNDDQQAFIIVNKTVVNDNGGNAAANDFALKVDGNSVSDEVAYPVNPGTHTASETTLTGYTAGAWGGDCATNGSVIVALGQTKTCTITNDDQAATLIVKKVLPNDNGGIATASQFSFSVNTGAATAFEVDGENQMTVNAGTYSVVETNPMTGYAVSYDNCTNVVIPNGGTATCTITNDDIAPKLTVTKVVVNDDGGPLQVSQVPLFVDTTSVVSGVLRLATVLLLVAIVPLMAELPLPLEM